MAATHKNNSEVILAIIIAFKKRRSLVLHKASYLARFYTNVFSEMYFGSWFIFDIANCARYNNICITENIADLIILQSK